MTTPYMLHLIENQTEIQAAIKRLVEKDKVQIVGSGYIDMIMSIEKSIIFIKELTAINVAVEKLSWWCLTTPESRAKLGCPHGIGGPTNKFGEGWFSECVQFDITSFEGLEAILNSLYISPENVVHECNQKITNYLINDFRSENFYSECLHPGLWLSVPDDWISLD
jgi:hypothetical protein